MDGAAPVAQVACQVIAFRYAEGEFVATVRAEFQWMVALTGKIFEWDGMLFYKSLKIKTILPYILAPCALRLAPQSDARTNTLSRPAHAPTSVIGLEGSAA